MPSTLAERRALAVVAAIATLGVAARAAKSRQARPEPTAAEVLALDAQIERVKTARTAGRGKAPTRKSGGTTPARGGRTGGPSQSTGDVARSLVDLDTASAATLDGLPWIGPALAARIVESRDKCGPFGSMEELTRVYGIGEGMSKRLAPYVTFSTPSRPLNAERTAACPGPAKGAAPRRRGRS